MTLELHVRERCSNCQGVGDVPNPHGLGIVECSSCEGIGWTDTWMLARDVIDRVAKALVEDEAE